MKTKSKIFKYVLIGINILGFIFIAYMNIKSIDTLNRFNLRNNGSIIKYNNLYITLYYILFNLGIIVRYSNSEKRKTKQITYISLFVLGTIFAIFALYKYYEIKQFISILLFSSASLVIISWIYKLFSNRINNN